MRIRRIIGSVVAIGAFAFVFVSAASAQTAGTVIDSYDCWKVKDTKSPAFLKLGKDLPTVPVTDSIGGATTLNLNTKGVKYVCVQADVNGGGLVNAANTNLCALKTKMTDAGGKPVKIGTPAAPIAVAVTTQFQGHNLLLKNSQVKLFLAPCDIL